MPKYRVLAPADGCASVEREKVHPKCKSRTQRQFCAKESPSANSRSQKGSTGNGASYIVQIIPACQSVVKKEDHTMREEAKALWDQLTAEEQEHAAAFMRALKDGRAPALDTLERIEKLPEPLRTVARLRTLYGLKWHEVARRANYTERYCHKLYEKAQKMMEGAV